MVLKREGSILRREGSFLDKQAFKFPGLTFKGAFDNIEADLVATAGELIGTASQNVSNVLKTYNEETKTASDAGRLIANFYVSAAFGLTLYSTATIFYRFTGSIFNPTIALALLIVGAIKPTRFVLVCTAQMIGGIIANAILIGLTPPPFSIQLELGEGISRTQGLFIEMFTTANFVLSVLMLGAEKHLLTPHAPLGFAFTMFAMMLMSIEYTGTGMNVARAFGTSCFLGFQDYHWIYWLGPTMGALLATSFYLFLKSVHYWDINPGQDSTAPLETHTGPRPDMHHTQTGLEEGLERLAERQV